LPAGTFKKKAKGFRRPPHEEKGNSKKTTRTAVADLSLRRGKKKGGKPKVPENGKTKGRTVDAHCPRKRWDGK